MARVLSILVFLQILPIVALLEPVLAAVTKRHLNRTHRVARVGMQLVGLVPLVLLLAPLHRVLGTYIWAVDVLLLAAGAWVTIVDLGFFGAWDPVETDLDSESDGRNARGGKPVSR